MATRTATSTGRARTESTDQGAITSTRTSKRMRDYRGKRTVVAGRPDDGRSERRRLQLRLLFLELE
jgi:hypothetical protein